MWIVTGPFVPTAEKQSGSNNTSDGEKLDVSRRQATLDSDVDTMDNVTAVSFHGQNLSMSRNIVHRGGSRLDV